MDPGDLRIAHVIHAAWGVEAPDGFLTVVFAADRWSGEPTNVEPDKHSYAGWVDIDDVPGEFVPSTHQALVGYLNGRVDVSVAGWGDSAQ